MQENSLTGWVALKRLESKISHCIDYSPPCFLDVLILNLQIEFLLFLLNFFLISCGWHGGNSLHFLGPCFPFQKLHSYLLCPLPSPGCTLLLAQGDEHFFSTALWPMGTLPLWFEPLDSHLNCSCLVLDFSLTRLLNLPSLHHSNSRMVSKAMLGTTVCRRRVEALTAV